MARRGLVGFVVVLAALAAAGEARAQQPQSVTGRYSPYEEETIAGAEKELGSTIDPQPEGKTIEKVDIVSLEVFEKRDPIPSFVNIFHATTRPWVIDQQLLIRAGQPYQKVLVDETARNLRSLPQLSLVLALAFRGSTNDKVRLVVITKDVWSLRLGYDMALTPGGLESLLIAPTETNIAGTHNAVLARFTYTPEAYSLGAAYTVPRLDGRWLSLVIDGNVVNNIHTGQPEGSFGNVTIQRPLFSTLTEWAWATGVVWNDAIQRRYHDASLGGFSLENASATLASCTPAMNCIPYQYRSRAISYDAEVTRSFGWAIKNDFTWGAEFNLRKYEIPNAPSLDPATLSAFVKGFVPVSDTRVGPFVQWRGYTTNFMRILDFETLGLQEDYRLGHDLWLRVYPVASALGSTRSFFGTYAAAQYTFRIGDGFLRGSVESTTEAETSGLSDAAFGANLRFVSPRRSIGRIVIDVAALDRYRNYLNRISYLGGDTRLRGFPTSYLAGKDVAVANIELRTRPVEVLATEVGGVLFVDFGDAVNGFDHFVPRQGEGVGLRVLFPQFERFVLRADFGVGGLAPGFTQSFFVTFGQAFPIESVGGSVASGGTSASTSAFGGFLGQ
jgi:hypothetical protein